jgi:hypothetical protein
MAMRPKKGWQLLVYEDSLELLVTNISRKNENRSAKVIS